MSVVDAGYGWGIIIKKDVEYTIMNKISYDMHTGSTEKRTARAGQERKTKVG
jgi:hypothetical protein